MKKLLLILTAAVSPLSYAMEEVLPEAPEQLSIQDLLDQGDLEEELEELVLEGELNLAGLGLTSLEGLENIPNPELVRELDLSDNDFTLIPDHAFDRFINLEVLDLTDNPLIQVQQDLLARLGNLKQLHLEDTKLIEIPLHFLDHNPHLEVLHLFDNKLESLPYGILDKLTELEEFDASRNKLVTLNHDLFRNQWKKLKTIDLSGNQLQSLPSGILTPVTELKIFDVSQNKLTILDANLFQNNLKLKKLWLDYNQLQQIPNITQLAQLKKLHVAGNKEIEEFSPETIKFIINAKISNDSPALMKNIPPYSLSQLIADLGDDWREQLLIVDENELITLDISNRGLTDLEFHDPIIFTDVQSIKANNNFITAIPTDFFRVYVPEYNGSMARFDNVWEIDLSGNLIQALPIITLDKDLSVLDTLDLHNNQIETIAGFKGTKNHLKNLYLSHNRLHEIPETTFNALHKLQYLELSDNQLTILPRNTFKNLPALKKIILRHNKLGNKEQYVFPLKAKVKFYPQEIPQLKMLAAKKVAQNMERMNLLEVIKTLRTAPADMHDALLTAASKNVALKIRNALLVENYLYPLSFMNNAIQSTEPGNLSAFNRLIQMTLPRIRKEPKDVQQTILTLAPEYLRNTLIQAGVGENIPEETHAPETSPEIAELAKSFENKSIVQTINMLTAIEPKVQRELVQVASRNARKKIQNGFRALVALNNLQKYPNIEFRLGAMITFNKLPRESQLAVYELAPEDVKQFLVEQGFNPKQEPAKEKEEASEEFEQLEAESEPFEFEEVE